MTQKNTEKEPFSVWFCSRECTLSKRNHETPVHHRSLHRTECMHCTNTADCHRNHRTFHLDRHCYIDDDYHAFGDLDARAHANNSAIANTHINIDIDIDGDGNGNTNANKHTCADKNVHADADSSTALSRRHLARAT